MAARNSRDASNKPTHEIELTIRWKPRLVTKTIDAEIGSIKAELINILGSEQLNFISQKVTKL